MAKIIILTIFFLSNTVSAGNLCFEFKMPKNKFEWQKLKISNLNTKPSSGPVFVEVEAAVNEAAEPGLFLLLVF